MSKKAVIQHQRDWIIELPDEIHVAVFFLVDPWMLSGAAAVSRTWRDLLYAFYARHPKWAPSHEAQILFEHAGLKGMDPHVVIRFARIKVNQMLPKEVWHKFDWTPPMLNGRRLEPEYARVPDRHRYEPTEEGEKAFEFVREREKRSAYCQTPRSRRP
jgi:hypothetical protein